MASKFEIISNLKAGSGGDADLTSKKKIQFFKSGRLCPYQERKSLEVPLFSQVLEKKRDSLEQKSSVQKNLEDDDNPMLDEIDSENAIENGDLLGPLSQNTLNSTEDVLDSLIPSSLESDQINSTENIEIFSVKTNSAEAKNQVESSGGR